MSRNKYRQLADHICISVPVIHEGPKHLPLAPISALIYGYLVFRSRKNRAVSKTGISRVLRLDRAAVTKALQSLEMLGLVLADVKLRWSAVEPSGNAGDLFRFRTACNGEWQSRFVYDRVYLPCSSAILSVKANLLFWRLYKLGKPVQSMPGYLQIGGHADCPVRFLTMAYLAKSVRCHRTTISSSLKRLARHGLITIHAIEGMRHKHAFAVGIPPIANRLDLWRKKQQQTNTSIVVTARQLFGVPSAMTVAPTQTERNDPEAHFIAHHMPGHVIQRLVAMIEEHSLGVDVWRPLLKKAVVKHEEKKATYPAPAEHCGFLFESMLEQRVKAEATRLAIAPTWTPPSYEEMMAGEAMNDMRLPPEGRHLLRSAVLKESLPLKDGGCVPCPLSWEKVVAIHKATKGEWLAFQHEITQEIFSFPSDRPPSCAWYEHWKAIKPIPQPDNTPLIKKGVSHSDARELRSTVDEWIGTFIEDERKAVEYGDTFLWLAAMQITGPGIKNAATSLARLAAEVRPVEKLTVDDELDERSPLQFRRY